MSSSNRSHRGRVACGLLTILLPVAVSTASDQIGLDHPGVFEREIWVVPSTPASLLEETTFAEPPDRREVVKAPIGARDAGDGFVQRVRGWIEAPATGAYRFAISSDDDSVLLLSPDGIPERATPVARVTGFTAPMNFTADGQISRSVTLVKGQRCYLEARHRDGTGGDHLVVAWKVPRSGFDRPMPIGLDLDPAFEVDIWNGVSRADPSTMAIFDTPPNRRLRTFEASTPSDIGANVAARLRGVWTAPADGEFVFMVSADDLAWLTVRRDGEEALLGTASLGSWTDPGVFEGRPGQVTAPIPLRKGEKVRFEGRLWQGSGPGHLAVGVRGPGVDERPVTSPLDLPGAAASP